MRQFSTLLCGAFFLSFVDAFSTLSKVSELDSNFHLEHRQGHGHRHEHGDGHRYRQALRSGIVPKKRPMLALVSLSLDKFGSKTDNSSIKEEIPEAIAVSGDGHFVQPIDLLDIDSPSYANSEDRHVNILAQVPQLDAQFDSRSFDAHPLNQALNFRLLTYSSISEPASKILQVFGALMLPLILMSLMIALVYCLSASDADEVKKEVIENYTKDGRATGGEGQMAQSTWARAYYEAEGDEREAFELLFRCNIISTEEFACSAVSREHIQECLWIGTHMLQHKPQDEWVGIWQQAQQSFEDNVAEVFEARGGQVGFSGRALAQRLHISRNPQQYGPHMSPGAPTSLPSSANLDFVSTDPNLDLRPLQS